jgi:hypothetical protein
MRFDRTYSANELLCFLLSLFFIYLVHFLFGLRYSSIYYFCTDTIKKCLLAPRTKGLNSYQSVIVISSVPVQFLTVVSCKILLFLNVAPCIMKDAYQRFRRNCCLHFLHENAMTSLKSSAADLWDATQRRLVVVYRRFWKPIGLIFKDQAKCR